MPESEPGIITKIGPEGITNDYRTFAGDPPVAWRDVTRLGAETVVFDGRQDLTLLATTGPTSLAPEATVGKVSLAFGYPGPEFDERARFISNRLAEYW